MNQFFSPTSRSPAVKFSYSSPNHSKSNIFCSPTHFQELSEQSSTLRLMTNFMPSPKINNKQIEERKKRFLVGLKIRRIQRRRKINYYRSLSSSVRIMTKDRRNPKQPIALIHLCCIRKEVI